MFVLFLANIDSQWHRVQDLIKNQLQTNSAIVSLWGQYRDSNTVVHNTLDKAQPITEAPLVFNTQEEVKTMLDKTKVGFCAMQVGGLTTGSTATLCLEKCILSGCDTSLVGSGVGGNSCLGRQFVWEGILSVLFVVK